MTGGANDPNIVYQTRVVVNPKNSFSMKPVAMLTVQREGLHLDTTPPLFIPFVAIRTARIHQLTDGVIEHGDQKTLIRGASLLTGAFEVPKIIRVINQVKANGALVDSEAARKQFGGLRNYWAVLTVAALPAMTGGAIGGLWGGAFGMIIQGIINQRPKQSKVFNAVVCTLGILGSFVMYAITILLLAQAFPGLIKQG